MSKLPKREHLNFTSKVAKDYPYPAFDLLLPRWIFPGKTNKNKLLLVLSQPTQPDLNHNKLLYSEYSSVVLNNCLEKSLDSQTKMPQEILAVNYVDCVNPQQDPQVKKLWKARLDEIVEIWQPTRILVFGTQAIAGILAPELKKIAPDLDNPNAFIGYLIPIQFGTLTVPTMATLPLDIVSLDGDAWKGKADLYVPLIGHIFRHLETLMTGNLYKVDETGFEYEIVDTLEKFQKMLSVLRQAKIVAIDTETAGLGRITNRLLSIQFACAENFGYFLPWLHRESVWLNKPKTRERMRQLLVDWLQTAKLDYAVFANALFDLIQLKQQLGVKHFNWPIYDIQAGSFALEENRVSRDNLNISAYSLGQIALEYGYFGYVDGKPHKGLKPMTKKERTDVNSVALKRVAFYGCKDVVIPLSIAKFQIQEAQRRGKTYDKFFETVTSTISDMIHCFVEMEHTGIPVDQKYLLQVMRPDSDFAKLRQELEQKLYALPSTVQANEILLKRRGIPTTTLFDTAPWVFNISKLICQQILFFEVLKLKPVVMRADGLPAVGKPFQEAYRDKIPEVNLFDQGSKLKTLYNSYIVSLYKRVISDPDCTPDSRLRPRFQYLRVVTGRSAAEKPSMQQIPSRNKQAKVIKRQFVARPGQLVIKADYSAQEIKNWLYVSHDVNLKKAFTKGFLTWREYRLLKTISEADKKVWEKKFYEADFHRISSEFFYGIPAAQVDSATRSSSKAVSFGVIYSKGATSLAKDIKDTVEAAENLIKTMFKIYKQGGEWIDRIHEIGQETCMITAPHGRVRHLWGYLHPERRVQNRMGRQGPNSMIQGMASDESYKAGRSLQEMRWEIFESQGLDFDQLLINQVHDATETLCRISTAPIACYLLEHALTTKTHEKMQQIYGMELPVGLQMEMELGSSFATLEKWDFRLDSQLQIIEDSILWANKELKHENKVQEIMKKVQHNAEIIHKIRRQELLRDQKAGYLRDTTRILNADNVQDFGFILN